MNLSGGEFRISFLSISWVVAYGRYCYYHFIITTIFFRGFPLFVVSFSDDQNDLCSQGTLICHFDRFEILKKKQKLFFFLSKPIRSHDKPGSKKYLLLVFLINLIITSLLLLLLLLLSSLILLLLSLIYYHYVIISNNIGLYDKVQ